MLLSDVRLLLAKFIEESSGQRVVQLDADRRVSIAELLERMEVGLDVNFS